MSNSLEVFKAFMADPSAWDMYITGRAGTGKTTDCGAIVQWCLDNNVEHVVCTYTHKACGVLRTKLPKNAVVVTLHSYLNKRPTLNVQALSRKKLQSNQQMSTPEQKKLIIIDEYSFIGERDYADVRALQDEDYDGNAEVKVLWLGDPYQLPSVGDAQAVRPEGDYQVMLTEIKRRTSDNPLGEPIDQLVSFIEGAKPTPLKANDSFIRGVNIANAYEECQSDSKIILAYTNMQVQALNHSVAGKPMPEEGDKLFCTSTKQFVTFLRNLPLEVVDWINLPYGGERLVLNTKYRTLEYLLKSGYDFCEVEDEDGNILVYAYVFGHYNFKKHKEKLSDEATASNAAIVATHKGYQPAAWAKANDRDPLARRRAKAWRDFLSFNDCVVCLDFPYAITVHNSQGSTYDHVFVDTQDIGTLANQNWDLYLKLMYVALSRAAKTVTTN